MAENEWIGIKIVHRMILRDAKTSANIFLLSEKSPKLLVKQTFLSSNFMAKVTEKLLQPRTLLKDSLMLKITANIVRVLTAFADLPLEVDP